MQDPQDSGISEDKIKLIICHYKQDTEDKWKLHVVNSKCTRLTLRDLQYKSIVAQENLECLEIL